MKTARILVAFLALAALEAPTALHAQTTYSFGLGLQRSDTCEIVRWISRNSEARDFDIKVGDAIIKIDGRSFDGRLLGGADPVIENCFADCVDSVRLTIRRDTLEFTALLHRTRDRKAPSVNCTMVGTDAAYLRLPAFDPDSIDLLEAQLDSLAKGSDGSSKDADLYLKRRFEANIYANGQSRDHSGNAPVFRSAAERAAEYRGYVDSYIHDKYGWQMQTLMIDFAGRPAQVNRELLRSVRLFCKEHSITLVRLI